VFVLPARQTPLETEKLRRYFACVENVALEDVMENGEVRSKSVARGEHAIHCAAMFASGRWIAMVQVTGPGVLNEWVSFLNHVHTDAESALQFAQEQGVRAISARLPPQAQVHGE
jgi:hypothetical protein